MFRRFRKRKNVATPAVAAAPVEDGILIGHALEDDLATPVDLPPQALQHHSLLIGHAHTGKTKLMEHLAVAAMERGSAVAVIDSDGDLLPTLIGRVPKARVGDVWWMDWGDAPAVPGLNWLDLSQGFDAETIISGFVQAGPLLWRDYWSPRVQDALMMSLGTLLAANRVLLKEGQPQFTCLDLPHLFYLPEFRHRLLAEYVPDPQIRLWWEGYYERVFERARLDIMCPLLTRLSPLTDSPRRRSVMGQARSTIPLAQVPRAGSILLVNEWSVHAPSADGKAALTSLLLHHLLAARQSPEDNATSRKPLVIVLNGTLAIPDLEIVKCLAELERLGVTFIMSSQSIELLQATDRALWPTLLSNVRNLFAFCTTAHDARLLYSETDYGIAWQSIHNLSDHTCLIWSQSKAAAPQLRLIETLPPQAGDPAVTSAIKAGAERYTTPNAEVEAERCLFEEHWYGRALEQLRDENRRKSTGLEENDLLNPDNVE